MLSRGSLITWKKVRFNLKSKFRGEGYICITIEDEGKNGISSTYKHPTT